MNNLFAHPPRLTASLRLTDCERTVHRSSPQSQRWCRPYLLQSTSPLAHSLFCSHTVQILRGVEDARPLDRSTGWALPRGAPLFSGSCVTHGFLLGDAEVPLCASRARLTPLDV